MAPFPVCCGGSGRNPDQPDPPRVPDAGALSLSARLLEYNVAANPLRDELLTEPLRAIEGRVPVPDKPGLGIELDPEAIRRYRSWVARRGRAR
jgi:hypothetical protein